MLLKTGVEKWLSLSIKKWPRMNFHPLCTPLLPLNIQVSNLFQLSRNFLHSFSALLLATEICFSRLLGPQCINLAGQQLSQHIWLWYGGRMISSYSTVARFDRGSTIKDDPAVN